MSEGTLFNDWIQGYFCRKEPPHPRTTLGAWAWVYGKVLGGCVFLWARYPAGTPQRGCLSPRIQRTVLAVESTCTTDSSNNVFLLH